MHNHLALVIVVVMVHCSRNKGSTTIDALRGYLIRDTTCICTCGCGVPRDSRGGY